MVNDIIVTTPNDRLLVGDEVKFDGFPVIWEEKELATHRSVGDFMAA